MKARFLIKAKDPSIITEKGVRVFVMDRLLNSPFEKGSVINIDDKTVEVRIEGDREQIIEFKKELEKDVISTFGNPVITFTDMTEIPTAEIPLLMRTSQALIIGQLHKGIDVQLCILDTLKTMVTNLKSTRDDSNANFKTMRDDSNANFKNLPKEIAKAIKEN